MAELNLVEIKFANREQGSSYPRSSAWFWEGSNKRKPRRRFSCVTEPSSGLFGQRKTTDFYQNFSKLTRGSEPLTEHNANKSLKVFIQNCKRKKQEKKENLQFTQEISAGFTVSNTCPLRRQKIKTRLVVKFQKYTLSISPLSSRFFAEKDWFFTVD